MDVGNSGSRATAGHAWSSTGTIPREPSFRSSPCPRPSPWESPPSPQASTPTPETGSGCDRTRILFRPDLGCSRDPTADPPPPHPRHGGHGTGPHQPTHRANHPWGSLDGDEPDPGPGGPWSSVWYHTTASSDGRSAILVSGGESGKPWVRCFGCTGRRTPDGSPCWVGTCRGLNPPDGGGDSDLPSSRTPVDPGPLRTGTSGVFHHRVQTLELTPQRTFRATPAGRTRAPGGSGRRRFRLVQIEVSNDLEHWTPFGDTLAGRVSTWTGYRPAAIQAPEPETDGTIFIRRHP